MKILKLLNKFFLSILVTFFTLFGITYSEEQPVDIWNLEKKNETKKDLNINTEIIEEESESIFKIKPKLNNEFEKVEEELHEMDKKEEN